MPSSTTLVALSLLTLGLASPVALETRQLSPPVALVKTLNYLDVVSVKTSNITSTRKLSAARIKNYGSAKLRDLFQEEEWAAKISFGGEEVFVILDTGSSDTWLVESGFQCVNSKGVKQAESKCKFGPVYNGTFKKGEISDENFSIGYGDGEFLTGNMGYSDVTIGGIHVTKQEVALVNKAYWNGDEVTSGLMGLAYGSLTSAYSGTNATADNSTTQISYSPIIQTMITQGLNPPIFSMALQRSPETGNNIPGGYIAFGGLPPVAVDPAAFVSTPILINQFEGYPANEATNRSFYTIKPDGYVYGTKKGIISTHASSVPAIVDSGTTLLYVPTSVANGYLASFDPPPTLHQGEYFYPCNATAPEFGIKIAGTTFNISSADIILPDSGFTNKTTGVEYCLIGVVDGGAGAAAFPIFGDVFLKNVVAVFDMMANTMQFAQHTY